MRRTYIWHRICFALQGCVSFKDDSQLEGTFNLRQRSMMPQDRRLSVRKTPKHIGYLSLPRDNGGFVIDISEGGLGFQAIAPLNADGPIQIRFAIDSAERIRVFAELAWIDETRKAGGLRFIKLPDEARAQIRAWLGLPERSAGVDVLPAEPAADSAPASTPTTSDQPLAEPVVEPVSNSVPASAPTSNDEPFPETLIEPVVEPEVVTCSATVDSVASEAAPLAEPALETSVTEPAMEAELELPFGFPPLAEIDVAPAAAAVDPTAHDSQPPTFSGPPGKFSQFSMFAADTESGEEQLADGASSSLAMKHPVAAVALTVVLAFLTSVPISAYVSTRAGDFLFVWSQKMWRAPASQTVPQTSALPAGGSANLPPQ